MFSIPLNIFDTLGNSSMTKINLETGQLVYSKIGSGPRVLLVFHGFGQDKSIFLDWERHLGQFYTIYSFDLFYHGESTRNHSKLTKKEWKSYLSEFLKIERIASFSVLGYSLGGRFAIATSLEFTAKTNELILIGPDGVFLTFWFKLVTNPMINWLFKFVMVHPTRLDRLMAFNQKIKVVDSYLADFIKKEMGDQANRKRVYISWNHFKSLGYHRKELIESFKKHTFKRRIILGNKDQIIRPDQILPIIHKMGAFKVDILPFKHHQLINQKVAKLLIPNTNHENH